MMVNSAGMSSSSSTTTFTPRSDTSVITQSRGNARFYCHAIALYCEAQPRRALLQQAQALSRYATRYDKLARNLLAGIHLDLAIILIN
jgi:hypothetical protein